MRLTAAATVLGFAVLLAACAGDDPAAAARESSPQPVSAAAPVQPSTPGSPVPAASLPAPAASAAEPTAATAAAAEGGTPQPYPSELAAHAGLRVDCQQDNECAVKDVGNCCGRYDACVRADSQPDPAAVQAECAAKGLAGICGFPVIEACVCTAGTCQAAPTDGPVAQSAVQ